MDAGLWGFIGVLAGAALSEGAALLRGRFATRAAEQKDAEARRVQLWELSRPVVGQLQDDFVTLQLRTRSYDFRPPGSYAGFDDMFDESWEGIEDRYRKNISLVPNEEHRRSLTVLCDVITMNYLVAQYAPFAHGPQHLANAAASLAVEVTASWLRGELTLSAEVHERLGAAGDALARAREQLEYERLERLEESDSEGG